MATAVAISRGAWDGDDHTIVSILQFRGISTILYFYFTVYFAQHHFSFHILYNTNTHHQMDSNEEAEVDTCNPRRKVI